MIMMNLTKSVELNLPHAAAEHPFLDELVHLVTPIFHRLSAKVEAILQQKIVINQTRAINLALLIKEANIHLF
jgi:hypothetical protein